MSTTERQGATQPARPPFQEQSRGRGREPRRLVRRRASIRRVDPWSVLKLSLIFYFCALLAFMLALTVFWAVINRVGLVENVLQILAEDFRIDVQIRTGDIARGIFLTGLLNVVIWSGINVFVAFLYNLVADLIGGLGVTLAMEE